MSKWKWSGPDPGPNWLDLFASILMGIGVFGIAFSLVLIAYRLVEGAVPFGKSILFAARLLH